MEPLFLENSSTAYGFTFEGVVMEHLEELPGKVREVLEGIASGSEEIDMERMAAIVKNHILNIRNNVRASVIFYARACSYMWILYMRVCLCVRD